MQRPIRLPPTDDNVVLLQGGMDQVTLVLTVAPGSPRRMLNYECAITGGYRRIQGYERYDGHTSPSSVTFRLVPISPFSTIPVVGQTLTGSTSGTTATIIVVGATYLAVTSVLGSGFQIDEAVTVAGVIIGMVGAQTVTLSKSLKKQYVNLAADVYRALISAVPGVGPVRGVFGATFNGSFAVYALRDRASDPTRCALYQATATGWVMIHGTPASSTVWEVNFSNGGPVPVVDNTRFSYLNSRPLALRAVLTSGSWAANTAAGKLLYTPDQLTLGGAGALTIGATTLTPLATGAPGSGSSTYEFQSGGTFETVYGNLAGQVSQSRIYACDGINRAWEFDGTLVTPIDAGTPSISPTLSSKGPWIAPAHVNVHQNHLFLGIGSSVVHSGIGEPFNFSAVAGAGELATSDTVTGMKILVGSQATGAMAITGRNHTAILYGTALAGPEPFDLVGFETETGALPHTIQQLDRIYYLDDRGVVDLKAVQEFGNFATATVTRLIQPFIDQKRGRAVCSMVHRAKGQYRIFFNDGTGLYLTFDNGKRKGSAPIAFPVPMYCAWSGEDHAGNEVSFLGGSDGFVYQLDRGTSFDGAAIETELLLPWNTMKSPRRRKSYKRGSIEIQDTDYTELRVGVRRGPHQGDHLQDAESTQVTRDEFELKWDHFTWDQFWWDAHRDGPLEVDVKGTSERLQYVLSSATDYLDAYTLTSIITTYFTRRGVR